MKTRLRKIFVITFAVFVAFAIAFYYLGGDQIKYTASKGNMMMRDPDSVTEEVVYGVEVTQSFLNRIEEIQSLEVSLSRMYKDTQGTVTIRLYEADNLLMQRTVSLTSFPATEVVPLILDEPIPNMKNKVLTIKITSTATPNHGVVVLLRKAISGFQLNFNDEIIEGTICFSLQGRDKYWLGSYYWYIFGAASLLLALFLFITYRQYLAGKANLLVVAIAAVYKYKFLISQLVIRDFKSKYKRSILGVFWSFLNPLLTMTVQFLVFSTFFRADTQNYPVYLLSGVVCFSFFSECTSMCLSSVSSNSRLITKVYIPKYIFPLSRTISSSINLGISLVPLFLACLVLGSIIRPQSLLFFYFLICLIIFSLGIGLFLSALMVFFRDIQFLWTVITQIWMYATPIFYPAEIIPEKYKFIVRFNPLYHFIGNARTCLIDGISPEPRAYLFCFLFAMVSLMIGAYTFRKTQDKFALYL